MAERRMFAKMIIDSDAFLEMPLSTQALYFHLSMRADDDGFVDSPKKIQRLIGASDDDCKLLLLKGFVIAFDNGVIVIRHWRVHNYIRGDRYKETPHKAEKEQLELNKDNVYSLPEENSLVDKRYTNGIPTVYQRERKEAKEREVYICDSCDSYSLLKENDKDIDYTSDSDDIVKGDKDSIKAIKSKGIDNKNTAKDKQKNKINRFIPPTVEEVRAYCEERQNGIDPKQFVDFYSSKGWMIGKNKMKDWKAAVRTWENKRKEAEKEKEPKKYAYKLDEVF